MCFFILQGLRCSKSPPNGFPARSSSKNAFLNRTVLLKLIGKKRLWKSVFGCLEKCSAVGDRGYGLQPPLGRPLANPGYHFTAFKVFNIEGSQLTWLSFYSNCSMFFPDLILEPKSARNTFYKFLALSLSLSLSSLSLSLSLFPFLFFFLFLLHFEFKKLKVEKVMQSTCWTPLTAVL